MTEENAMAPLPWGREVIEGILPHRDPFVWVSRIMAIEPGASIEGELDVPADLDIFRGHFPDHPVLPGVISWRRSLSAPPSPCFRRPSCAGKHRLFSPA